MRASVLDVALRVSALAIAAWALAAITWTGADLVAARSEQPSAAVAAAVPPRVSGVARGAVAGRRAAATADVSLYTEDSTLPAGAESFDDQDLPRGQTRLVSPGADGLIERTYRVRSLDGEVVSRELVSEQVVVPAAPARMAVGTGPVAIDTPYGRLYYAATHQVVATYYTPANGGKAPGARGYGITATGARATRGIVAVDPRVIPLYSWLYVPGYGIAQARDVGASIIGDHIDVAFDDGDGAWWGRRYLTVYVLAR